MKTLLLPAIILVMAGMLLQASPTRAAAIAGDDIKCERFSSVYHFGEDGKRHAYPNEKIYFTHNAGFGHVKVVSCETLGQISLGKNVLYRGGMRLIKAQSVPKVYAVGADGILHALKDEAQARHFYGSNWAQYVDDISEAFLSQYRIGEDYSDSFYSSGTVFSDTAGPIYRADGQGTIVEITDLLADWQKEQYREYALSLSEAQTRVGGIPMVLSSSRSDSEGETQREFLKKFLVSEGEASGSVEVDEATEDERSEDLAERIEDQEDTSSRNTAPETAQDTARDTSSGNTAPETAPADTVPDTAQDAAPETAQDTSGDTSSDTTVVDGVPITDGTPEDTSSGNTAPETAQDTSGDTSSGDTLPETAPVDTVPDTAQDTAPETAQDTAGDTASSGL